MINKYIRKAQLHPITNGRSFKVFLPIGLAALGFLSWNDEVAKVLPLAPQLEAPATVPTEWELTISKINDIIELGGKATTLIITPILLILWPKPKDKKEDDGPTETK